MNEVALKDPEFVAPTTARRRALIKAMRRLPPLQRIYLRALEASRFNKNEATEEVEKLGYKLSRVTVWRWAKSERFSRALELTMEDSLERAGINPNKVLLDVRHIADRCMEKKAILHHGKPTGEYTFDSVSALKALELLGKNKRLWNEDERTRITIGIELIDWSGPKTIDVNEARQSEG